MGKKDYRIGMIGLGTVGTGVLELLHRRREELELRLGKRIEVRRIAVKDLRRQRNYVPGYNLVDLLTQDPLQITRDPEIDMVVEVAGGIDGPHDWLIQALECGKDIVTANKAVLATHGAEIFGRARELGRKVWYEASVAGAIPIIDMLQNGLAASHITRLSAILNGTCNYVLTRMEEDRLEFEAALRLAQEKGFAEADPTLDISGGDSAHKLALLAGIITRSIVPLDRISVEGMERVTGEDIEFAGKLGYRIKMLAIAKRHEEGNWEFRVHPTLIPREEVLAQVSNEFNAVSIKGDAIGSMLINGKGAGSHPTAASIIADLLRAGRGEGSGAGIHYLEPPQVIPLEKVRLRHYVRMRIRDVPGTLGRVASHFGLRGISIASLQQPEGQIGHPVPVVLVTHVCEDRIVTRAIHDLEGAGLVEGLATRIRIEE
jgi:homoserine dehydrogenase